MSKQATSAGLFRRIAAMVYDAFLLFGLACTIVGLFLVIAYIFNLVGFDAAFSETIPAWILMPPIVLSWISFYTWFWRRNGQTLGMVAWKIQLVYQHGERPPILLCVKRCLLATLSFFCLGIGYFWLLFDHDKQCLHDRYTQCIIVKVVD